MAAQAATKQKEAGAVLQAKIDTEVAKRTKDLVVLTPPSPAKPKTKTTKTGDVAPDLHDDRVSLSSGASKGAKRQKKHAERAEEVAVLCDRLFVFEEALNKVPQAATKKKPSGYSSEDDTRPNNSLDSKLRSVINAVQRGLRKARAKEPKRTDDLANKVCALLSNSLSKCESTTTIARTRYCPCK